MRLYTYNFLKCYKFILLALIDWIRSNKFAYEQYSAENSTWSFWVFIVRLTDFFFLDIVNNCLLIKDSTIYIYIYIYLHWSFKKAHNLITCLWNYSLGILVHYLNLYAVLNIQLTKKRKKVFFCIFGFLKIMYLYNDFTFKN